MYLFSPLLDHWLGSENYGRPHTHVHLSESASTILLNTFGPETEDHFAEDNEHEDSYLCLLDINALFYVALNVNNMGSVFAVQNSPLIFDLSALYLQVSGIYLSAVDPPPRSFI